MVEVVVVMEEVEVVEMDVVEVVKVEVVEVVVVEEVDVVVTYKRIMYALISTSSIVFSCICNGQKKKILI